jgi:hypothetical protein
MYDELWPFIEPHCFNRLQLRFYEIKLIKFLKLIPIKFHNIRRIQIFKKCMTKSDCEKEKKPDQ